MHRLAGLAARVRESYEQYQFHRIHQEIHQFCAVDLGGFYLDVIKDRVYCDAPDSARRASARATMHEIADALIRMLAPILPFTAEEAWGCLPGAARESVHLQTFASATAPEVDDAAWEAFFALREQVNTALDAAKKEGRIGSSIAAEVTAPDAAGLAARLGEPLEQLLIVAAVREGDAVSVAPADGVKCPRCWIVGQPAQPDHAVHGALCPRCFAVVAD